MRKLFYTLFISSVVLASCMKQDPIEVVCDCTGSSSTLTASGGSSLIDTNLTGHWKLTNLTSYEIYPDPWTGQFVDTIYYWDNGQIDLHFFADGTWDIDGVSGTNDLPSDQGTYTIHSNNCIDLGPRVFNYSINNGVLTFSPVPGHDYLWILGANGVSISSSDVFTSTSSQYHDRAEINNLVKQ